MRDDDSLLDNRRFLPEIARLLFTWQEHEFEPCAAETLCYWARMTAGWTRVSPEPLHAIAGLGALTLLNIDVTGECFPSPLLRSGLVEPLRNPESFPTPLARCLLESLIARDPYRSALIRTLQFSRIAGGAIHLDWSDVPREDRRNDAWIWLQQLDLATHDGSEIRLHPDLLPFVLDVPPNGFVLSQIELDARLQAQRQRALQAEEYVVQSEKQRLCAAGREDYAVGVIRISDDDVLAGYDILSFDISGKRRFVEVKSSSGPFEYFVWSRNEFRCAHERGESYWLSWLGWSSRLPAGPCELLWFRNPAAILGASDSPWMIGDGDIHVRVVQEQMPYAEKP